MTVGVYDRDADVLRFPHPDGEVVLPALHGRAVREWNVAYARAVGQLLNGASADPTTHLAALTDHVEAVVDLVLAYDRSGALGGRDRFENRWTDQQAYLLLELIVDTTART
jgi:hypothetical protein